MNAGMRTAAFFDFEIQHTGLLIHIRFPVALIAGENPGERIWLERNALHTANKLHTTARSRGNPGIVGNDIPRPNRRPFLFVYGVGHLLACLGNLPVTLSSQSRPGQEKNHQ